MQSSWLFFLNIGRMEVAGSDTKARCSHELFNRMKKVHRMKLSKNENVGYAV